MPTLQCLADNGLTYAQWHTTALCSPTRSVFLTGRNHHQTGFASTSRTTRTWTSSSTSQRRWRATDRLTPAG
jgi:arylsulfatase A-like enzyme